MNISSLADKAYTKRLVYAGLLVAVLAAMFWTGSRYPALDEKAMMGGAIHLEDPLSFEALIPLTPELNVWERIGISTINWMDTNKKGMTFGLLLGAAFLTLLGYLRRRNFSGPFANSLYGMFLGAPLGVCVNCAAPVAKGLYQGGSRAETTLSAMIASPTLNIVVMTMAFSLLPFYIAVSKLVLSLLVILLAVPILCRFIPEEKLLRTVEAPIKAPEAPMDQKTSEEAGETYFQALVQFGRDFGRNLVFILKAALPLMLLAGFLGAIAATLIPVERISEHGFGLGGLALAALVGTFLPTPIGFDVVLSGALLNGGAGHGFVMTLVFTLGSFSIYSFLIVGGSVGWRAACLLGAIIMALGFCAGLGAEAWHKYQMRHALELLLEDDEALLNPVENENASLVLTERPESVPSDGLDILPAHISFERLGYGEAVSYGDSPFTRLEAWHLGIDHPVEFSFADMWPPFWEGRSVASGDIDRDGDIDLVFASTRQGLYIYSNDGSGQFSASSEDLGAMSGLPIFNAVLVDIDNDGWLDLFLTTYQDGLFVVPNREGRFEPAEMRPVANREDAILALAASFDDVDQDGDLDVALGNWAAGWYRRVPGEESRNRIIFNDDGALSGQTFTDLPGIPGETLSILFSDINHDGRSDLLVGNDFEVPDYYYLGDGQGGMRAITHQDGRIPMTTTTTMSLSSADLTNNGEMEIYAAQIAGRASGISDRLHMQDIERYCSVIERESDRDICQQNMDIKTWYRPGNSLDPSYASRCAELAEPYRAECRGMLVKDIAIQNDNPQMCDLIPVGQIRARQFCEIHFQPGRMMTPEEQDAAIPQILARNVLLETQPDGRFDETAELHGVEVGGWSWDVSIADFDNDGWQDVYIVNGTWVPNEVTPSNIFLHNGQGGGFEEVTEAWGLQDYLITAAASVVDLDNDGDLDIVAVPVNAPVVVFMNNARDTQSISFEFSDLIGNRDGIGARVEITYGDDGSLSQVREIQLGGGFMSFDAPVAFFGLGDHETIASVSIEWADGSVSQIDEVLEAGARYRVIRDSRSQVQE